MAIITEAGPARSGGAGWTGARSSPAMVPRRRPALASLVAITVATGLALSAGLGARQPSPPKGTSALSSAPGGVNLYTVRPGDYTVRPGDTLWGIATALAGNGDPRPIMERLTKQAPDGVVVVGQRLVLP